jgi:hypothetical protein
MTFSLKRKAKNYRQNMNQTKEEIVEKLLNVISEAEVNANELVGVLSLLLISVGASLEGCEMVASEKVLIDYAERPTLGNALMAQAIFMKETWNEGH